MPEHRSIQDIIPPVRSHPTTRPPVSGAQEKMPPSPPPPPTPPQPMRLKPERSGFAKLVFIVAGVLLVTGIGIGVASTVFNRAYVTVTPYRFSANIEESLQVLPDGVNLPYQKVSVTDTATKSVPATGSEHVENRASGTITVYNSYSASSQRLITNTRFETKDGLVYRIHAPIVISGYTMKAGVKAPGSIDTLVYADQAGDTYNIDLMDFTVPGLKGSKQYDLIFARSKTPMSGGFIGEQAVVDPTLRSQTIDSLKADLDRLLRAKIAAATIAGTIVFNDSITITYTEGADTLQGSNAVISVSGQAVAPAFNETALARQFVATSAPSYDGLLAIENPNDLSVHVDPPGAIGTEEPLTVSIAGTAHFVSTFDGVQLARDLAGKNKKDIQPVIAAYPAISIIDVKLYPFWLSTLPVDPAKVKVRIVDTDVAENP
ncbi:MAG: hypothetical protein Q7R74_01515 [bacterium]|nr:hypothetical protein [bacterium]